MFDVRSNLFRQILRAEQIAGAKENEKTKLLKFNGGIDAGNRCFYGADKTIFPMLTLIAVSHMLTILTIFSFEVFSIKLRAYTLKLALPAINHKRVCVSRSSFIFDIRQNLQAVR